MRRRTTLSTKLLTMGLGFLLVTLTSISVTLWVTWKLEGGAAAVNEAGRLRMHTMRMALAVENGSRERLLAQVAMIDASLELLRTGDPSHPLFVPWSKDTRSRFEQVRSEWAKVREEWMAPQAPPVPVLVVRADALAGVMNGFVDAIEVQIARWTAALHVLQLFMMGLAIFVAFAAVVMTFLVVLNPVARLRLALERVRQGELGTRLEVDTDDEFGQLAAGFNLMAHALQASHTDLESKVREKTASVEIKNQRLAALYEVSALATQAGSLQVLAKGFVRQVRAVVGADAAVVRWSDEGNERYVMLAADGLPEVMAQEEHCLNAGNCLCGQSFGQARMRVIPILPDMQMELPHCHEAGYRTLVAIPIALHQRVLGELNLFFRSDAAVPEEMRELLDAMVGHLASSMEGLRAAALEREAAVSDERSLLARELHDSIAQSLAFLKIQTQLLRDAVKKGNDSARDRSMAELDVGVRECYADVRELLVHFRTRASGEDIEEALRTTLSKFGHQTGIAAQLSMEGHGLPLDADVQIQVLHMVQEALSNVRKHAQASHVEVRVQRHPRWRFEVQDDGLGFDVRNAPAPDSLHVGLGIVRERAAGIGARVSVESTPGSGTTVCIELPQMPATAHGTAASPEAPAPHLPSWSST
ncbi:MAG: type IV pili methyl-accepting chemotaxis transducer N-terminal domain-containing protein [Giesbergeria sp.]